MPSPPISPTSASMNRTISRPFGLAASMQRNSLQEMPLTADYDVEAQTPRLPPAPSKMPQPKATAPQPSSLPYLDGKTLRSMSPTSRAAYAASRQQVTQMPPVAETDASEGVAATTAVPPLVIRTQPAAPPPLIATPHAPPPRTSSQVYSQLTTRAASVNSDTLEVEIRGMQAHQTVVIRLKNGG